MMRCLTLCITLACAAAYVPSASRRQTLQAFVAGLVVASPTVAANALDACNPNANNCVFVTWTPPPATSRSSAIKDLRSVIEAYPQEGQAVSSFMTWLSMSTSFLRFLKRVSNCQEVDGGGWSIASDNLDAAGTARVEYRSSGKGFFAKAFNGGKPFVDDLNVEVDGSGHVQVRSQSRVGDSDLGVNKKRVDYLAAGLKEKGWTI